MIKACAEAGDIAEAQRLLCIMVKSSIETNSISDNSVIRACSEAGDVAKAERLRANMHSDTAP